jgi:hypothetical protein
MKELGDLGDPDAYAFQWKALDADLAKAVEGMAAFDKANEIDTDPTPWCSHCGPKSACDCGPIAEND